VQKVAGKSSKRKLLVAMPWCIDMLVPYGVKDNQTSKILNSFLPPFPLFFPSSFSF
jgi:hypothetical protein